MVKEPCRAGQDAALMAADLGTDRRWWLGFQDIRPRALISRRVQDPRWQVVLAVAPDRAGLLQPAFWPAHLPRWPQGRRELGDRMGRMLRRVRCGPVCVMTPGAEYLRRASARLAERFAAWLGTHVRCSGPHPDGGLGWSGLKTRPPLSRRALFWKKLRGRREQRHALTIMSPRCPITRIICKGRELRDVDCNPTICPLDASGPVARCYLVKH